MPAMKELADSISQEPGFIWKIWTENQDTQEAGGIYLFQARALHALCASAPPGRRTAPSPRVHARVAGLYSPCARACACRTGRARRHTWACTPRGSRGLASRRCVAAPLPGAGPEPGLPPAARACTLRLSLGTSIPGRDA